MALGKGPKESKPAISEGKEKKIPKFFDEKLTDVMRTALKRETKSAPESPDQIKDQFFALTKVKELIDPDLQKKLNSPDKNLAKIGFAELVAAYQKKYLKSAGLLDDLGNLYGTTAPQAASRVIKAIDYTLGKHVGAKKDVLHDKDTVNEYNNKLIRDLQVNFIPPMGGAPLQRYYYDQAVEVYNKVRQVFTTAFTNRNSSALKTKERILGNDRQISIYMPNPSTPAEQIRLLLEDARMKVNPPKIREYVIRIMKWYDIAKLADPKLTAKQFKKLKEEVAANMREKFEEIKVEIVNNVHLQRHTDSRWITFDWDPGEVYFEEEEDDEDD